MGYDVHITRKQHWSDEDGEQITLAEWLAVVEVDASMRLDGHAEAHLAGDAVLRVESEGLSVWTGWSGHGKAGGMAWFDYWRGSIAVKNPDPEILRKMWELAQALSAQVQGDEGELYGPSGEPMTS
jgi:hypothetical protein